MPCRGNAAVHNAVRADAGGNRKLQRAKLLSDAAEIRLRLLRLDGGILPENGLTVAILIPVGEKHLLLRSGWHRPLIKKEAEAVTRRRGVLLPVNSDQLCCFAHLTLLCFKLGCSIRFLGNTQNQGLQCLRMAAAERLGLIPVIGAPYDPDLAVNFIIAVRRRFSVHWKIRLCQHILKRKPLYPCELPGNRVGKCIRLAFSYLVAAGLAWEPAGQQRHIVLLIKFQ